MIGCENVGLFRVPLRVETPPGDVVLPGGGPCPPNGPGVDALKYSARRGSLRAFMRSARFCPATTYWPNPERSKNWNQRLSSPGWLVCFDLKSFAEELMPRSALVTALLRAVLSNPVAVSAVCMYSRALRVCAASIHFVVFPP